MTSGIEQASQELYRRYFSQFGTNPLDGGGFRFLAELARLDKSDVEGIRRWVTALNFSTRVVPAYLRATPSDTVPLNNAAWAADRAAEATDASARINIAGADRVAAISRREAAEIAAVPDPDSPAGQAAVLAIIEKYQNEAAQVMTRSAAAQQQAGQQAASSGSGATGSSGGGPGEIGRLLSSLLGSLTGAGDSGQGAGNPLGSALGGMPLNSMLGSSPDPDGLSPFEAGFEGDDDAGFDGDDTPVADPTNV